MKKILGILVIAGSLVACNDSANSTENKVDSTDSASKAAQDTIENRSDRAKDSVDAAAEATKDSLNKKDTLSTPK